MMKEVTMVLITPLLTMVPITQANGKPLNGNYGSFLPPLIFIYYDMLLQPILHVIIPYFLGSCTTA